MACSSTGCQSNCYKNSNHEEDGDLTTATTLNPESLHSTKSDGSNSNGHQILCVKCKTNLPFSPGSGGDDARFCADCFRRNLYGKFRLAVTSHAMITPSDNVLVAFSGGPASRVVLQFVHEMQHKAQKNFDASKDRSLPVFGVGLAFVDESSVHPVRSAKINEAVQEMRTVVTNLAPPTKQLHVVPIESVYGLSSSAGKERLAKLLNAVDDATGKEDLLVHLRMLTLQKVASENGYNRIVLGSCTSRIACHVIAATLKGQGYSLSADIQYVDARWEAPVVLPLRDCTAQELNLLCRIDGLKTVQLPNNPSSTINSLVSSFVNLLQEENPSRECTIVRTAGKLRPFHFNKIPEINDCNVPLATRRRQKRYNLKPTESISSDSLCYICHSPFNSLENFESSSLGGSCCSSCRFQILPEDLSAGEDFRVLLPQKLSDSTNQKQGGNLSLLREQIQDCLLSDSESET